MCVRHCRCWATIGKKGANGDGEEEEIMEGSANSAGNEYTNVNNGKSRATSGSMDSMASDPNPDPPPLVDEIQQFNENCCLRLTLWQERVRRKWRGLPPFSTNYVQANENSYGVSGHAVVETQGYRPYMEDRFVATSICNGMMGLFSVLDGHGLESEGHIVAEYAAKNLATIVEKHLNELKQSRSSRQMLNVEESTPMWADNTAKEEWYRTKMDNSLTEIDNRLRRRLPIASENNGATITTVIVEPDSFIFANLGDSRAVLVNDDYTLDFVTLDHKPTIPSEERRVMMAGGFIDDFRVNGDLAVSRTLGDVTYKPLNAPRRLCPISNEPDVTLVVRESRHRCIILASDGIWDALSSLDVSEILKKHALFETQSGASKDDKSAHKKLVDTAFQTILRDAMETRLSSDNATVLLVFLDPLFQVPGRSNTETRTMSASSSSSSSSKHEAKGSPDAQPKDSEGPPASVDMQQLEIELT